MTKDHIDKKRAQAAFNKASVSYEEAAVLQKHVLGEMFLRLKLLKINPETILDLGCGEGRHAISAYMLADVESVGIDLSQKDLTTTRERHQEFLDPNNQYHLGR